MAQDIAHGSDTLSIRVDRDVCFSNDKGVADDRARKQQLSYLKKLEPLLRQVLGSGERVLYIARGQWPQAILDVLTSGWLAYFMNQAMIIATSERLLFVRVKQNNSPIGSLSEILYGGITSFKRTGFGQSVLLTYQSGTMERFSGMQPKVSAKFVQVLGALVPGGRGTSAGQRQYLCPRCRATLIKGRYTCPNCNLQFKDPATALKYGLVLPGGGFFYMRKKFFGFQYAFSEVLLLGFLITALAGVAKEPELIGMAIFVGILFLIIKVIHVARARSYTGEFVPAQTDSATVPYA